MKSFNKKTISIMLIFTILTAIIMPTVVNASGLHNITVTNGYADNSSAEAGDVVTITASVPSGKEFAYWNVDTAVNNFDDLEQCTFVMPDSDVNFEAVFRNVYTIVSGDFQNFETNTTNDVVFVTNSTSNTVTSLYVGGDEVDTSNYAVSADGTTITLYNSYLVTLSSGMYGFVINYAADNDGYEGYAVATIIVEEVGGNSNLPKISTINATISTPDIGTKIVDENTKPVITLDTDADYYVSWTMFIDGYPSENPTYDAGNVFGTTIEDGGVYYVEVFLRTDDEHVFDSASNVALTVNGGTEYEVNQWSSDVEFSFFAKIIGGATSTTQTVYEFTSGAGQKYTIDQDNTATFTVNAEYNLFANDGKVYVDDGLVASSNYTSSSGSTVITFTKDYMKSLGVGSHTLKIEFNDNSTAETTFTVVTKSSEEETSPSNDPTTSEETNPSGEPTTSEETSQSDVTTTSEETNPSGEPTTSEEKSQSDVTTTSEKTNSSSDSSVPSTQKNQSKPNNSTTSEEQNTSDEKESSTSQKLDSNDSKIIESDKEPTTDIGTSKADEHAKDEGAATTYNFVGATSEAPVLNKNEDATFKINAEYSLFKNGGKVYVDEKLVSSDNYTSKEGSTIITLAKNFINTLDEGVHTLKVAFNNDATATTKFEVAKADASVKTVNAEDDAKTEGQVATVETTGEAAAATTNNPQTGDNIIVWICIMIASIAGIILATRFGKKKDIK